MYRVKYRSAVQIEKQEQNLLGENLRVGKLARPTGIEPVSRASETLILSIELRAPAGNYTLSAVSL